MGAEPLLFWVKNEEITDGRKDGRANKQLPLLNPLLTAHSVERRLRVRSWRGCESLQCFASLYLFKISLGAVTNYLKQIEMADS